MYAAISSDASGLPDKSGWVNSVARTRPSTSPATRLDHSDKRAASCGSSSIWGARCSRTHCSCSKGHISSRSWKSPWSCEIRSSMSPMMPTVTKVFTERSDQVDGRVRASRSS